MRGWQEDDCNSYTGRPWRSRIRVRKGGGGREEGVEAWCRQSRIIPRVYKR